MTVTRRTLIGSVPVALAAAILPAFRQPLTAQTPDTSGAGGVPALLSFVPAGAFAADEPDLAIVVFSDLALELEHTGVAVPESFTEDDPAREVFSRALIAVGTGSTVFQFAFADDWRDLHGFDIGDVDQVAEYGRPPDRVTLVRGRFDRDAIDAALADQRYETIDVDGIVVWNRGADYDTDLQLPISRYWLGEAQNIALLDDVLVFAGSTELIETVIRTASGEVDALAGDQRIAALFTDARWPLASAMIVRGDSLAAGHDGSGMDPEQPEDDAPFLPPVSAAVFGATAGSGVGIDPDVEYEVSPVDYPIGRSQIRVLFADPDDAPAGRDAIEERIYTGTSRVTGQSWLDLFEYVEIEVTDGEGIVVVRLPEWWAGQRSVPDLVARRDTGFLAWDDRP